MGQRRNFFERSVLTPKEAAEKALRTSPASIQEVAAQVRGVETVKTPTPQQIIDYLAQQAALVRAEENNE